MMIDRSAITSMEQRHRARFVNALPGYKSANLIGTADVERHPNLAIVSSVIHLGSDPPLLQCLQLIPGQR